MIITEALHDPAVSAGDRLAIGAACIEEEALMRTARLMAGDARAAAWYTAHGGRFRFSDDGEHLMIQVPVQPFALDRRSHAHFPPESGMDDQAAYDNGLIG